MRQFEFRVHGSLPPKKDGATSMWGKPSERQRLIALRRAAWESLGAAEPLEADIRMVIEIHCPKDRISRIGDLDNFITGICDGLMAATGRVARQDGWKDPELAAIEPSRCIAIRDDREVMEILARKIAEESAEPWYRVTLVGA